MCFSKPWSMVMKFFELLSLNCKIQLKTFILILNLSLISNKALNLYSVICFETNAICNKHLMKVWKARKTHYMNFLLVSGLFKKNYLSYLSCFCDMTFKSTRYTESSQGYLHLKISTTPIVWSRINSSLLC